MKVNQAGRENKKQRVSGFSQTGREKREEALNAMSMYF
jgi:hypothetical protein